jgi:hypothetical protein
MKALKPFVCATAMLVLLTAPSVLAQTKSTTPPTTSPRGTTTGQPSTTGTGRTRAKPCWQQVGISQSVMQQRKQLDANTHAQIQSVCNDSSLTAQQKREKIHQLREQARNQIQGLLSSEQEQALRSCRERQHEGGEGRGEPAAGGHGMHHGRGGDPCGKTTSTTGPRSMDESEPEK